MCLSLKAVQWFTICGTSPPIVNLHGGDVPPIVNHCTAFNDRYKMFLYFLSLNNKIIVFIPTPANSNMITES